MDEGQYTRVIAIRHGETAWNAELRLQGHVDIELNERGRPQAQRMAAALADAGVQAVYSSDLLRARVTAEALAAVAGISVQVHRGLRERAFGEFEGLTYAEIEERWPEGAQRWRERDPEFAPAGGESLHDFYGRVVATGDALAACHRGQVLVLVAHGGVLDCLYRAATHADLRAPRSWALGNATINRLLHTDQGFSLVGWDDAAHLDGTG